MAQINTGIRRILSHASMYRLFGDFLGANRARKTMISKFIRPRPCQRILDVGCGPATLLEFLPKDVKYTGIDLSAKYIAKAKKQFGSRAVFHCCSLEDMTAFKFRNFDLIIGMGILHHLDEKVAEYFFRVAEALLQQRGRCLTIDPCRVSGQKPLINFLIRMDRGQNIRNAEGYVALAKNTFKFVNYSIHNDLLRIPYTHILMESRIGF